MFAVAVGIGVAVEGAPGVGLATHSSSTGALPFRAMGVGAPDHPQFASWTALSAAVVPPLIHHENVVGPAGLIWLTFEIGRTAGKRTLIDGTTSGGCGRSVSKVVFALTAAGGSSVHCAQLVGNGPDQ
jgi:hypothetical protein